MAFDAVLFDFFGTLVRYTNAPVDAGYDGSYEVVRALGGRSTYADFVGRWRTCSDEHEREALRTGREYSMDDVVRSVLTTELGTADQEQVDHLRTVFVDEWRVAVEVEAIPGAVDLLAGLAEETTVAVVSNTHDHDLVPRLLIEHGLAPHLAATLLSVEVGYRKPHEAIFRATVERLGVELPRCLFVGDSYEPDYAGPTRQGMRALLIDPAGATPVPDEDRIDSVLDVTRRVARTG